MADHNDDNRAVTDPDYVPYQRQRLSYANTFTNPFKVLVIRVLEWLTGKYILLRLIRKFERQGVVSGQEFFTRALQVMRIDVTTPTEQTDRIPATGPVVVVANHPHGLVDGLILADLIGRVRDDYKILTRSLLTGIPEIEKYMLPVAFPHEENSQRLNIAMRKQAMAHLSEGGVIVLFPAGAVAASETLFGPAVEADWNPFTAKMIQRSGAKVVPIYFPGHNTRLYQMANRVSATLRQGLLLHEVVKSLKKPQKPVVGEAIDLDEIKSWADNPRGFTAWLRKITLDLRKNR
ncbi:MAG: acyltransferase [Rhodobacterales bacterium]|nr:MAG: acyltransferase [Rhodobacterales bacterium]